MLGLWGVALAALGAAPLVPLPPTLHDAAAGQALAAELCNLRPPAGEFKGQLKIRRPDGQTISLALSSWIRPEDHSWQSLYQASVSNLTETLVVRHVEGGSNEYRYGRSEGAHEATLPPVCGEPWQSFAGSDFFLADLGLEFFHWPTQVVVRAEMRKSRACQVLESRPGTVLPYARVLSWIDVESNGLLMAEAYDAANQRIKEFEVKRFKKNGDQLQVQELEMRHYRGGSRTNAWRTVLTFQGSDP
jgi:hypothetical protein